MDENTRALVAAELAAAVIVKAGGLPPGEDKIINWVVTLHQRIDQALVQSLRK